MLLHTSIDLWYEEAWIPGSSVCGGGNEYGVCASLVVGVSGSDEVLSHPPMLCRLGDTEEVAEYGSLHQYLKHRHAKDGPVVAFWWTNQQRIVSIASPDTFKATTKLFDRPGTTTMSHQAMLHMQFLQSPHTAELALRMCRYIRAIPSPCCMQARRHYCVRPFALVSSYHNTSYLIWGGP